MVRNEPGKKLFPEQAFVKVNFQNTNKLLVNFCNTVFKSKENKIMLLKSKKRPEKISPT